MAGHNPEKLADPKTRLSLSHPQLSLLWTLLFRRSEGLVFTFTSSRSTCHLGASTWRDEFSLNRSTHVCLLMRNSDSVVLSKYFPLYDLHRLQICFFFPTAPRKSE